MPTDLRELSGLRGLKAKHIPSEYVDGEGWQKRPEKVEDVTLLQYFHYLEAWDNFPILFEGILFIRQDMTLGKDALSSFVVEK